MEVKKETVCEDTLYIIREYYHLNTGPLFDVLASDCVWLGIGNLLVSGAEAIKAQFQNGFIMPPFELEESSFRQIETGSEDQLMVLGGYTLYASGQADMICTAKQRLTFCYRKETGGYRLYHMHVSNEYSELVGEEVFPVQVTKQTYRYVQRLLKESGENNNRRLAVKTNGSLCFVDTGMIQYIQALERESILYLVNEHRQVQASICLLYTSDAALMDAQLERDMDAVLNVVNLGRACRNTANIKNRQPIGKIYVSGIDHLDETFLEVIRGELNAKEVELGAAAAEYITYNVKPQMRTLGPKYGLSLIHISGNIIRICFVLHTLCFPPGESQKRESASRRCAPARPRGRSSLRRCSHRRQSGFRRR